MVLDHGVHARIVGRDAEEPLVFVPVELQVEVRAEDEVFGDGPGESTRKRQVAAFLDAVVVADILRRSEQTAVLVEFVVVETFCRKPFERDGRVLHDVAHARVAAASAALFVGPRTRDFRVGEARLEIERNLARGLVLELEGEVVAHEVRGDHHRVVHLTGVTGRVGHLVTLARECDVVVLRGGRTSEDDLLPVVARIVLIKVHVFVNAEIRLVHRADGVPVDRLFVLPEGVLVRVEHVGHRGHVFQSRIGVERHLHAVLPGALGRDHDDAVGAPRTVDGRRGGVFQHVDRLDVRGRDVGDRRNGEAVHDVERRTALRDGVSAADVHRHLGVGGAVGGEHLHAGQFARDGLGDVVDGGADDFFGRDRRNGSREVGAAHGSVADHDHFVDGRVHHFEPYVDFRAAGDGHFEFFHAYVGEDERIPAQVHALQGVFAADAGRRGRGLALEGRHGAEQRFAVVIGHDARQLLGRRRRKGRQQAA